MLLSPASSPPALNNTSQPRADVRMLHEQLAIAREKLSACEKRNSSLETVNKSLRSQNLGWAEQFRIEALNRTHILQLTDENNALKDSRAELNTTMGLMHNTISVVHAQSTESQENVVKWRDNFAELARKHAETESDLLSNSKEAYYWKVQFDLLCFKYVSLKKEFGAMM